MPSRGLRIGVNALYLIPGGVGGTEIYLRSLLQAIAGLDAGHDFFLYTNRETADRLGPEHRSMHRRVQPVWASNRAARLIFEQWKLPAALRRDDVDVLLNPGFTAPFYPPCPNVTVFHDLQHKRHPEYFRWFDLPAWDFFLSQSARNSRFVIAVSEFTRQDVLRFMPIVDGDVVAIPLAADEEFFSLRPPDISRPYLLCPSTSHPHKNHAALLRAYASVRNRLGMDLVLTGIRGFAHEELEQTIAGLRIGEHVYVKGWLPRSEFLELFAGASALIYPSRFEGFGIPVLEALAAGIPVACSDIPPLKEVAGTAALFFDPTRQANLAEAIIRIATDEALRSQFREAGPRRARQYSWVETARRTISVLEAAAAAK